MIRGTTPTFTLTIEDESIDLGAADHVYVTIRQSSTVITKQDSDLEINGNVVSCWIEEDESLGLIEHMAAEIQINWTYGDRRAATKTKSITIGKQLLPEELT